MEGLLMRGPRPARGVSLVEALVALAVLALGLLAILGVQSTLRLDADVARQRAEATRIAHEAIEAWRAPSTLEAAAGRTAYADVSTVDDVAVAPYPGSPAYTLVRTVSEAPGQNHKTLHVAVRWTDRSGAAHEVVLDTVVARSLPAAFAPLATSAAGTPTLRPRGRHAAVPLQAQDMGNGTSVFKPPQPEGGTTAWVFDNASGFVTGICSVGGTVATLADLAGCSGNTLAHLLAGHVGFARSATRPDAAEAERPGGMPRRLQVRVLLATPATWPHPGPPVCHDDSPTTSAEAFEGRAVGYFCLIPANAQRVWAGTATIVPLPYADLAGSEWSIATAAAPDATHRLCRYTPARSDAEVVANWQHPLYYRIEYPAPPAEQVPLPMPPLVNQNFLVVDIAATCPADVAANPAADDFVDSNTLEHRPSP
jgi:Tfp pilus assembly protein PilV